MARVNRNRRRAKGAGFGPKGGLRGGVKASAERLQAASRFGKSTNVGDPNHSK